MSIKVKILKENKKANIEESMLDPNTLMMIAGALGVGVPLLKAMFSGGGGGTEAALELTRDGINAKLAKAGMSPVPKQKINQSDKPSAAQRVADKQATRTAAKEAEAIADKEAGAAGGLPPDSGETEEEKEERAKAEAAEIDKDVKRYVAMKNKVRSGEAKMSNKKIQALIKKYSFETLEAMDNATDSKDYYPHGSELNEIFKRFLK